MSVDRFVLDIHLGRLARYLRLLGFDSVQHNIRDDDELLSIANSDGRTLLSCDRPLIARPDLNKGYLVGSRNPLDQLKEVVRKFDLSPKMSPFSRCLECNGEITEVPKHAVSGQVKSEILNYHDTFYQCASCHRIYWKGTHYERMQELVRDVSILGLYISI